jgi:hypothetical protein
MIPQHPSLSERSGKPSLKMSWQTIASGTRMTIPKAGKGSECLRQCEIQYFGNALVTRNELKGHKTLSIEKMSEA